MELYQLKFQWDTNLTSDEGQKAKYHFGKIVENHTISYWFEKGFVLSYCNYCQKFFYFFLGNLCLYHFSYGGGQKSHIVVAFFSYLLNNALISKSCFPKSKQLGHLFSVEFEIIFNKNNILISWEKYIPLLIQNGLGNLLKFKTDIFFTWYCFTYVSFYKISFFLDIFCIDINCGIISQVLQDDSFVSHVFSPNFYKVILLWVMFSARIFTKWFFCESCLRPEFLQGDSFVNHVYGQPILSNWAK